MKYQFLTRELSFTVLPRLSYKNDLLFEVLKESSYGKTMPSSFHSIFTVTVKKIIENWR